MRWSTCEAGTNASTPKSTMMPPLTASLTVALENLARLAGGGDVAARLLEVGAALGQNRVALVVFGTHHDALDLGADLDFVIAQVRCAE